MIKFAITHIDKDGIRRLTFANRGQYHYDTKIKAELHLNNLKQDNSEKDLKFITDGHPETLEVYPIECYDHGDAKSIYLDINQKDLTYLYHKMSAQYDYWKEYLKIQEKENLGF